jgi:hypothetical protein
MYYEPFNTLCIAFQEILLKLLVPKSPADLCLAGKGLRQIQGKAAAGILHWQQQSPFL